MLFINFAINRRSSGGCCEFSAERKARWTERRRRMRRKSRAVQQIELIFSLLSDLMISQYRRGSLIRDIKPIRDTNTDHFLLLWATLCALVAYAKWEIFPTKRVLFSFLIHSFTHPSIHPLIWSYAVLCFLSSPIEHFHFHRIFFFLLINPLVNSVFAWHRHRRPPGERLGSDLNHRRCLLTKPSVSWWKGENVGEALISLLDSWLLYGCWTIKG